MNLLILFHINYYLTFLFGFIIKISFEININPMMYYLGYQVLYRMP